MRYRENYEAASMNVMNANGKGESIKTKDAAETGRPRSTWDFGFNSGHMAVLPLRDPQGHRTVVSTQ